MKQVFLGAAGVLWISEKIFYAIYTLSVLCGEKQIKGVRRQDSEGMKQMPKFIEKQSKIRIPWP